MNWLKNSGYIQAGYNKISDEELERKITCGNCGAEQSIYIHKNTGSVEGIVFDCCKCGERNELSTW